MPDIYSPERRSLNMSRVRSKDTDIEVVVRSYLHKMGYRFRKHVRSLPGTPDIVFSRAKVAVFIDGDFWHGYHFRQLKPKLSQFWSDKIQSNRNRDLRNFKSLRGMGWCVVRCWKHSIKADPDAVAARIAKMVDRRIF